MALYNEILVGRFNRYLQKLSGIRGSVPVPQLSGEITAVIPFQVGAEDLYPQGWNRFGNFLLISAALGVNGGVQIRNPGSGPNAAGASNVVAVLEKVICDVPAPGRVSFSFANTLTADLGTPTVTAGAWDGRQATTGSVCIVTGQNTPSVGALVNEIARPQLVSAQSFDWITDESMHFPLLPGSTFRAVNQQSNSAFMVAFVWRERFLEDSERI